MEGEAIRVPWEEAYMEVVASLVSLTEAAPEVLLVLPAELSLVVVEA